MSPSFDDSARVNELARAGDQRAMWRDQTSGAETFRRDRPRRVARWHRRCAAFATQEVIMKVFVLAGTLITLIAAPAFAQTERGVVTAAGGFAVTPETTSGDALGEVAVRVAPRLLVFGDVGQFHNVQP